MKRMFSKAMYLRHQAFLFDSRKGEQMVLHPSKYNLRNADLRYMNLAFVDFSNIDMSGASIDGTNFNRATLTYASMPGVHGTGVNLNEAYMTGVNLTDANLQEANAQSAAMEYAILINSNWRHANLACANLSSANLTDATMNLSNLNGTNLAKTVLTNADFRRSTFLGAMGLDRAVDLPEYVESITRITPDGELIVYKALGCYAIAQLIIPADAARSNATGRKCRAERAYVKAIWDADGVPISGAYSKYDPYFRYTVGEWVIPDKFDPNRWEECSNGIHFFLSRKEAEEWL